MQQFLFLACKIRDTLQWTANVTNTNEYMTLEQSKLSIWIGHYETRFSKMNFDIIVNKPHAERKGHAGSHVSVTFKLDHLGFIKPIFGK